MDPDGIRMGRKYFDGGGEADVQQHLERIQPLSRSKCWREDRRKKNELMKSPLAKYIGFMFCFTMRRLPLVSMK